MSRVRHLLGTTPKEKRDALATWAPPAESRWRLRAAYKGTIDASPSRSGYAHLLVKRP